MSKGFRAGYVLGSCGTLSRPSVLSVFVRSSMLTIERADASRLRKGVKGVVSTREYV
jgi:hypothetical protein